MLRKAVFTLEPLPLGGNQINHRDWRAANLAGQFGDLVEIHLGRRADDNHRLRERLAGRALVLRNWKIHLVIPLEVDIGLAPLPLGGNQINHRDWRAANLAGQWSRYIPSFFS